MLGQIEGAQSHFIAHPLPALWLIDEQRRFGDRIRLNAPPLRERFDLKRGGRDPVLDEAIATQPAHDARIAGDGGLDGGLIDGRWAFP